MSEEREPAIEVVGLTTGHGGVPVVRSLDLSVNPGEVVALLGPNGAGKTTTLLTISGLLPILGGTVEVLGRPIGRSPAEVARRGLAHVAEDRSLFFDLTVAENLQLGLRGDRAQRARGYDLALDLFPQLRELLGRHAGVLSGGEQQMLAIARAVAAEPKALMVDEMSLGLAPVIVERLLPIIRQVADELGAGVLLVEQHITMALEVADRAYVLDRGQVRVSGTAHELLQDRALLEASYLGDVPV